MVTEKRMKEIKKEAKRDYLEAYECGQIDSDLFEPISDEKLQMYANEWGMTVEEVKIYIDEYIRMYDGI